MKIYLIGYMGSGKTSIGKKLAEKLQWQFLDMDEIIEKRYEMSISDIFRLYGESEFRGAEHEILKELTNEDNAVISTGGGAPCFFDNMELMNNTGKTFYFNFSPSFLAERLLTTNLDKRPILSQLKREDFEKFIADNIAKRQSFYNQAHYKISGTDDEIENKILEIIRS